MWDAGEIEKTEKRLSAIKDQIQFRILVDIRDKVNRFHDSDNSRILSTLEEVAKQHAGSKADTKRMIEKLNNADEIGRGRHEELVQLGTQLLDGINAISITRSPSEVHDATARKKAEEFILKSLWYSSIHSREETISETYADTLRWIFEDPKIAGKPWDSFVDFLNGDTSKTYWITGKPGSGKSTLMKFINVSPQTQALLQQWAGERELIAASFYFYYRGDENQKSKIGLIRSLLYSILDQRRDLIPTAFKNRYQDALEGRERNDLSLPEAKRAMQDLLGHSPNLVFFISIDGLDEFDPAVSKTRVQSLIDLTRSLEEHSNAKVLVASRPLPEFELGYEGRPSLSVHHLTQEDIRRYANGKLLNHPRMEAMAQKDPESAKSLLQSLVERSLGVFLWVRVVTESLMEGLTNYDSIDDLKKRVDDLPSEIQDLYMTMLNRIDPRYKPQTARLLVFVSRMTKQNEELALLDLWFAENADGDMVRNTSVKPIEDGEIRERVKEIQALLKSRCMGLIETTPSKKMRRRVNIYRRSTIYDDSWNELKETARFIHRSVYEFLNHDDIWAEVVAKHLNPSFDVTLSFFRSVILVIKTYRQPSGDIWENITSLAILAGTRANSTELETRQPYSDLLHELDVAMHGVMPLVYRCPDTWRDMWPREGCILDPKHHWSAWCRNLKLFWLCRAKVSFWPLLDNSHGSLMAFAAEYGLKRYIENQVASEGRKVLVKTGLPLLGYALIPVSPRKAETIKYLVDEACDPNEIYNGMTLWEWFLWEESPAWTLGNVWIFNSILIMEAVLLTGANPNAPTLLQTGKLGYRKLQLDEIGLSWYPNCLDIAAGVCTLLFHLNQTHQFFKDRPDESNLSDETIQELMRIIRYLEERGAVKKEWKDNDSIIQIFREINQRISSKAYSSGGSSKGRRRRWHKRLGRGIKCYIRRWK